MPQHPKREYSIRYRYANGDDHCFHVTGVRQASKVLRDVSGYLYREVLASLTDEEVADIESRAKPPEFGFGARK